MSNFKDNLNQLKALKVLIDLAGNPNSPFEAAVKDTTVAVHGELGFIDYMNNESNRELYGFHTPTVNGKNVDLFSAYEQTAINNGDEWELSLNETISILEDDKADISIAFAGSPTNKENIAAIVQYVATLNGNNTVTMSVGEIKTLTNDVTKSIVKATELNLKEIKRDLGDEIIAPEKGLNDLKSVISSQANIDMLTKLSKELDERISFAERVLEANSQEIGIKNAERILEAVAYVNYPLSSIVDKIESALEKNVSNSIDKTIPNEPEYGLTM